MGPNSLTFQTNFLSQKTYSQKKKKNVKQNFLPEDLDYDMLIEINFCMERTLWSEFNFFFIYVVW